MHFLKSIGNRINRDLLYMQKESDARAQLSGLLPVYFPYSHYSIKYYDLEKIISQIMFSGAKRILELGSGLTTLCMAKLSAFDPEISIHSIEHNEDWIRLMQKLIRMNEMTNIDLEYVPLKDFSDGAFKGRFYDFEKKQLGEYDSIIIDGPPANRKEWVHSRYPAIYVLKQHLKKNGFFYFDDVARKGELECLDHWTKMLSFYPGMKHQFGKGQIFILKP